MPLNDATQLTIDFTPGLTERHESLLACLRECAYTQRNPLKTIAADMDMSQSELSRKLASNPGDPRHMTVEDLESFIDATGDTTPIQWLIEKYMQDGTQRQKQAVAALARLAPLIESLTKQAVA